MADPLSVAASAIAVATLGFHVSKAIRDYCKSARATERQLEPVIEHIDLTANALQSIATLLENHEIRNMYTADLLESTDKALTGCRKAFNGLNSFVSTLPKPRESTKGFRETRAKLSFYFKQKEFAQLQAHLKTMKAHLSLVLTTLNLVSSVKSANNTSTLTDVKEVIERLLREERTARAEQAALASQGEPLLSSDSLDATFSQQSLYHGNSKFSLKPSEHMPSCGRTKRMKLEKQPEKGSDLTEPTLIPYTPQSSILEYLAQCAQALRGLVADVDQAVEMWHATGQYQPHCLHNSIRSSLAAMNTILLYDTNATTTLTSMSQEISGANLGVAKPVAAPSALHPSFDDGLSSQMNILTDPLLTMHPLSNEPSHNTKSFNVNDLRQEVTEPAYFDRTQSDTAGEPLKHASQPAEHNKQLSQTRGHRARYLDDEWRRPHESRATTSTVVSHYAGSLPPTADDDSLPEDFHPSLQCDTSSGPYYVRPWVPQNFIEGQQPSYSHITPDSGIPASPLLRLDITNTEQVQSQNFNSISATPDSADSDEATSSDCYLEPRNFRARPSIPMTQEELPEKALDMEGGASKRSYDAMEETFIDNDFVGSPHDAISPADKLLLRWTTLDVNAITA